MTKIEKNKSKGRWMMKGQKGRSYIEDEGGIESKEQKENIKAQI